MTPIDEFIIYLIFNFIAMNLCFWYGIKVTEEEAVEKGFAEYDSKTREFKWKGNE